MRPASGLENCIYRNAGDFLTKTEEALIQMSLDAVGSFIGDVFGGIS